VGASCCSARWSLCGCLTTLEATYFDITRRHTQAAVLTAMAVGMFMNAAIGVAFDSGRGWAFVVPLVANQVVRGVLTATTAPTPLLRQQYRRAVTWIPASAPFWIANAADAPEARLWWWGRQPRSTSADGIFASPFGLRLLPARRLG
jgi:low temperature requirement protein LtrA